MLKSKETFLLTILVALSIRITSSQPRTNQELRAEFQERLAEGHDANAHDEIVQQLFARIKEQEDSSGPVSAVVCYGIGALFPGSWLGMDDAPRNDHTQLGANHFRLPNHYRQLALCDQFRSEFQIDSQHAVYGDPILEPIEHHLVQSLGLTLDTHENCDFNVDPDGLTIIYAPALPIGFNEVILFANWSPEKLESLIFIGTDMDRFFNDGMSLPCWNYVVNNNIAQVWALPGTDNPLFNWYVTFEFDTYYLPDHSRVVEPFELNALNQRIWVRDNDEDLVNFLNTDGDVGHLVVYGIGPFIEYCPLPSQAIFDNNQAAIMAFSLRAGLLSTGTFYLEQEMKPFELQVIQEKGFIAEANNFLQHTITDMNHRTLIMVFADYQQQLDNVLSVNWTPHQLRQLIFMYAEKIQFNQTVLWRHLLKIKAIQATQITNLWLCYQFRVPAGKLLPPIGRLVSENKPAGGGLEEDLGNRLVRVLTRDRRVSHVAVYGLATLDGGDANTIFALRGALRATGTFYAQHHLSHMDAQLLAGQGYSVAGYNHMMHTVRDTQSKTLVIIYGDHSAHIDKLLESNWSSRQLNNLVVMNQGLIDVDGHAWWRQLGKIRVITVTDVGSGWYLYTFKVINNSLLSAPSRRLTV